MFNKKKTPSTEFGISNASTENQSSASQMQKAHDQAARRFNKRSSRVESHQISTIAARSVSPPKSPVYRSSRR